MIFGNWRPAGLLAGSALFGYVDGMQLRAGGEAVHSLLSGATLLAVVVALWWVARRHRRPAAVAALAGVVVYAVYMSIETVPREFATYAPQPRRRLAAAETTSCGRGGVPARRG